MLTKSKQDSLMFQLVFNWNRHPLTHKLPKKDENLDEESILNQAHAWFLNQDTQMHGLRIKARHIKQPNKSKLSSTVYIPLLSL